MLVMNCEQASWWLAGIIDGEGSVYYHEAHSFREVVITNTDERILDKVREALYLLGVSFVEHWDRVPNRKPCCRICITRRENLTRLGRLPLQSEKKEKLTHLLASYKRPNAYTRRRVSEAVSISGSAP